MAFERFMDRNHMPGESEISAAINTPLNDCWAALDRWLREAYQIEAAQPVFGPSYGWSFRYRKAGRPLCEIYPEHGAFTVQVVLGQKEGEQALAVIDSFGPVVRECLEKTPVYHDGRWLFIRVQAARDVEDIRRLVQLKRAVKR